MKMASIMQTNSIQMPFNYDINLLKSPPISYRKNFQAGSILRRTRPLLSGGCACGRKYYHLISRTVASSRASRRSLNANHPIITRARKTEREEEASASRDNIVREASRSQSPNDIDENDASTGHSGEATSVTADFASSLRTVGLCVFSAVAFGVGLGFKEGVGKASEFFAGYLLEQSLSVDNLFVFVLIFKYFKVPLSYQSRVLSYGIAGAVIFRLTLILLGTVTLQRFEAVNLLLATILLYSSFKLFTSEDEDTDLSDNFIVKTCQKFIPVTCNVLSSLSSLSVSLFLCKACKVEHVVKEALPRRKVNQVQPSAL